MKSRRLLAAAYSVNSYPNDQTLADYGQEGPFDGGSRLGALSNVGYQQAKFNLATMKRAGLQTPIIWLDVEPVPDLRVELGHHGQRRGGARRRPRLHRRRLPHRRLLHAGAVGHVVGDLRLGIPEWRAAGQTSRAEALRRCGADRMFQGGKPVLSQWVRGRPRPERHLPGHLGRDGPLVPPVLSRSVSPDRAIQASRLP